MIKKSVFEKTGLFNPDLKYAEDWQLWLKVCECFYVAVIPEVYVSYLIRDGSITQADENKLNNLESIKNIISCYKEHNSLITSKSLSKAEARLSEEYADYYSAKGNKVKALLFGFRSFFLDPKHRRVINFIVKIKKEWILKKMKFSTR